MRASQLRHRLRSSALLLSWGLVLLLLSPTVAQAGPTHGDGARVPEARAATPLPQYDELFTRDKGWNGADALLSVALAHNRTLWLYGDTFYGPIVNGKRCVCITRNSVGIQHGKNPDSASITFFYGPEQDGDPTSFFSPPNGDGWFWPRHGVRTTEGLYIFLTQLVSDSSRPEFIYGKRVASWIVHIPNPEDRPTNWKMSYDKLPWSSISDSGADQLSIGQAVVRRGFLYIYATKEVRTERGLTRFMMTARVPEHHLADFDRWRFFTNGRWSKRATAATVGLEVIAPDFSVNYATGTRSYVAVYSDWAPETLDPYGKPTQIVMRTAKTPVGPWSPKRVIYRCPERRQNPDRYCYAAKAHPELSTESGDLMITYATANSRVGSVNDVEVYFPTFVRYQP